MRGTQFPYCIMAILSSLPSSLSSSWKNLLHSFFKNFFFFSGHSWKRNQYRADLFSLIISVCWIRLLMEVIHTTHTLMRDWRMYMQKENGTNYCYGCRRWKEMIPWILLDYISGIKILQYFHILCKYINRILDSQDSWVLRHSSDIFCIILRKLQLTW